MEPTDKELLELAAKAAGYKVFFHEPHILRDGDVVYYAHERGWPNLNREGICWWNPLADDGDTLRLAVELGIEFGYGWNADSTIQRIIIDDNLHVLVENNDPYAAARRAIVRAASEIGKQKE